MHKCRGGIAQARRAGRHAFFDAAPRLASSTAVPVVHWDALEKLKVTCSVHLSATLSVRPGPMWHIVTSSL
eukprot:scaffold23136_cov31-Phaeocystis_antarctica.AAC.1